MTRTPLRCFNELLQLVSDGADEDGVGLALREVEDELDRMSSIFHTESAFHEDSPSVEAVIRRVYELYDGVFRGLESFRTQRQGLEECAQALNEIFDAYAQIRELSPPPASQSPFLAELVRVARACQSEQLPWEAFDARFAAYHANFLEFVQAYEEQELDGRAWGLSDSQREGVTECLRRINDCLLDLEEGELGSLDELVAATDDLMGLHRQISDVLERPRSFCCPRCGANNDGSARVCAGCGAVLPRQFEETSTLDLHSEQGGATAVPERLRQLGEAIDGFLAGELELDGLLTALEAMAADSEQVALKLAAMGEPVPELREAREQLEAGQQAFLAVLEHLIEQCEAGQYDQLRETYAGLLEVAAEFDRLARQLTSTAPGP